METSLTSLTPEQQQVLNMMRSSGSRSFTPRIPEIKLSQKDGTYSIQEYDQEKKEKVITNIGKHPHIVILKKAVTYSYYDEDSKSLVAWTSDINGYSEFDDVVLYKNDGVSPYIEFKGNYPEFKKFKTEHYTTVNPVTEKATCLLSFKTVLYVLFNGKVYRMFVTNPGVAGIAEGSKTADFKNPQLFSLIHFLETSNDMSGGDHSSAIFENVCELDSRLIPSTVDFYIMEFKKTEEKPDLASVIDTYTQLINDLEALKRQDIARMTKVKKEDAVQVEETHEISDTDLPF